MPSLSVKARCLPSGRPERRVQLAHQARGQRFGLPLAVLGHEVDLILAAHVRDERDLLAVRRPAGLPVVGAGAVREVAHGALLDGHGEHVAAGHEEGALALGRQGEAFDVLLSADARGPRGAAIRGHGDGDALVAAVLGVHHAQLAVQLVDDARLVVAGGPAHVPGLLEGELLHGVRGGIHGVEVQLAVAVRGEVHLVADPHGVALGARAGGDLLLRLRGQVEDVEILRPAALVALPVAEVAEHGRVGDALAVRREGAGSGRGHGQLRRQAALQAHGVEGRAAQHAVGIAAGAEQHTGSIRRPAHHLVVVAAPGRHGARGGIEGELAGDAAVAGHDVDLLIAIVLAREGDPLAIGAELREQLQARMGRQPHGRTARGGRGPQVAPVGEHHLVPVDVREAQQLRLGLRRAAQGEGKGQPGKKEGSSGHRFTSRLGDPSIV